MKELGFHPLVARWFADTFEAATDVQLRGWRSIGSGLDTLVSAPTGSGKTLAAFLWSIDELVREAAAGSIDDRIHTVYVSPLKALGNDIDKNLSVPLRAIRERAHAEGLQFPDIRSAVRSGDTPARERSAQLRRPPHLLITTPESLYILLTAEKSRQMLAGAKRVIVDEIHAVCQDKRGLHLALSLERLDRLAGHRLQRIGLSATQKPIEEVARLLVGSGGSGPDGTPRCTVIDSGHRRTLDLAIEIPNDELGPVATHEMQAATYDRIARLTSEHRSTLVFTNTRRMVERVAHALGERLGHDRVAAHHGSLSRETRLASEQRLKSGEIPVVVATASLELGIDVGHVDLVCQLGVPRSISTFLQRVGRSGHHLAGVPKGILFPLTRDDLVQAAALVRAIESGALDSLVLPRPARDVLAQQIVATVAAEEIGVDDLFETVRGAYPYRGLARDDFDAIVHMLAEGVSSRRGRRGAHLHYDRVGQRLRPRRGARLSAITSGGAIPDTADYDVVLDPEGTFLGKVNEDFAIESLAGDIIQLGNHSWRVRRVEMGRMRVEDAGLLPPTIPFWLGEGPGRTDELSQAVADLRREIAERRHDREACAEWLRDQTHTSDEAAAQMIDYVSEGVSALGAVPALDTVVAERFFDEAGGMQLVLHAPFGMRINRAFGLALRKRFCVSFDFELQAAATDDGLVLSLGEQHSFPLESVFAFVRSHSFRPDLVQAALQSPMFANRWRWNASRALVLARHRGGKKVPIAIQRMQAEDLLAAVFPAQVGCQDNRSGPIEVPSHPLVEETTENCLHEAMDADGLARVLEGIETGRIRTRAVDTAAPSVFAHELLGAGPYAFLDDAPLEERRARAVALRRTDAALGAEVSTLDESAIAEVRTQAWPAPRDADEAHDALVTLGLLPVGEAAPWRAWIEELRAAKRATAMVIGGREAAFLATERKRLVAALFPEARWHPEVPDVGDPRFEGAADEERASVEITRGWMDSVGPTTAETLAARIGLAPARVAAALAALEADGCVLQGRFTRDGRSDGDVEWCERGLLARIHRLTVGRLRREIEAVSAADFMRFLLRWQHVHEGTQLHGREGVRSVIAQLGGLELPATAWERDVLPARVRHYDGADLELLCLGGEVIWGRLSPPAADAEAAAQLRRRARPTRSAPLTFCLRSELPELLLAPESATSDGDRLGACAKTVLGVLRERGASFASEIVRTSNKVAAEVEDALWELVTAGLVTGDGVAGLRALLSPDDKRRAHARGRGPLRAVAGGRAASRALASGRWALLRPDREPRARDEDDLDSRIATRLLHRYGVVFRDVVLRERALPPWRRLLRALRRMEARGIVRGGRFVAGFVGEQFALPHAVDALRAVRRTPGDGEIAIVAAADPLNLVGIVTPGARVSPFSQQAIAFRGGVPVEVGELGSVRSRLQRYASRSGEAPPARA